MQEAIKVIGVTMHEQKQQMIRERDSFAQAMHRERKGKQAMQDKI